jgi:hypothetical protein
VGVASLADADAPEFVTAMADAGFVRAEGNWHDNGKDGTSWPKRFHGSLLGATGTGKSRDDRMARSSRCSGPRWSWRPTRPWPPSWRNEFRELLPRQRGRVLRQLLRLLPARGVHPADDTYIEKDSSINDEVERLRHSATNSLLTRRDVIVVASVSCIYGLGTPQEYVDRMVERLHVGDEVDHATDPAARLVDMQYTATTWRSPAAPSGCAATPSRSSRVRGARGAHRDVRRRVERITCTR